MRAERLFRVLGLVDSALTEEALAVRRSAWRRWAALAACLVLVIGVGWLAARGGYGAGMPGSSGGDGLAGGDSGGPAGTGEGSANDAEAGDGFSCYAGPVLPLTTMEDPAGLTAERETAWDFAPGAYSDGEERQWGAKVTDAYTLHNSTDGDITVTALYPFAGSFSELAGALPAVTADGAAAETVLYAGPYSGGFQSTFGAETPDTMNLDTLGSWEGYRALLESGAYLEQALEPYPALDMPVTVYEFSDFAAPHETWQAATQAVSFDIDESATQILTYGFNGCEWDGGFRRYSYFVPDGVRHEPDLKVLAVLGEDIGGYTLEGYQDGGCDPGEEIEGVSCMVTRSETTLDALLDRLCRYFETWYGEDAFEAVPFALYRGAAAELMEQYGVLSGAPMDRYAGGRLDDLLQETLHQDRVLYLGTPVTVPAGGSVRLEYALWKAPSFDYCDCAGSENEGLQGYDLVTRLGSGLTFTRQSAALVNLENVELSGQDFGFDPENGVTRVELDLEREHYDLAIRPGGE